MDFTIFQYFLGTNDKWCLSFFAVDLTQKMFAWCWFLVISSSYVSSKHANTRHWSCPCSHLQSLGMPSKPWFWFSTKYCLFERLNPKPQAAQNPSISEGPVRAKKTMGHDTLGWGTDQGHTHQLVFGRVGSFGVWVRRAPCRMTAGRASSSLNICFSPPWVELRGYTDTGTVPTTFQTFKDMQ